MIVAFPDESSFRLALTSAAVPANVSGGRTRGAVVERRVFVECDAPLAKTTRAALADLGAKRVSDDAAPQLQPLLCWHQLLALQPTGEAAALDEATEVLFEASDAAQVVELCSEMLRLGNDRLATGRMVRAHREAAQPPAGRYLVRATNPPYYTLLRAMSPGGASRRPVAYVQQRPRVWVELGYTHPLAAQLEPRAGTMLLLRPSRQWELVEEPALRDIYTQLDVQLEETPNAWQSASLEAPLRVSLRLAPGGGDEPATMWVLHEDAQRQVEQLVEHADSALLERLSFAVGTLGERRIVVLRARASQQPPPVLVLRGVALRSYLKLPNLFVPCGFRLDPPLRRDVVAAALAADDRRITWLSPCDAERTRFTPESLPDLAFRPLADWVQYVIDQDHAALAAWVQAARFDFEPFVSSEELLAAAEPSASAPPRDEANDAASSAVAERRSATSGERGDQAFDGPGVEPPLPPAGDEPLKISPADDVAPTKQNQLEAKLHAIEGQYLRSDAPLDTAERVAMWRDMAQLNSALENARDATIGWINALWQRPEGDAELSAAWLRAEAGGPPRRWSRRRLEQFSAGEPSSREMSHLAASLVHAARARRHDDWGELLEPAAQALHRHEAMLPVRATWLAWQALADLSGGDVLSLARTRDRLLERLLEDGLRLDVDAPTFVRANLSGSDRLPAVRGALVELRRSVHRWVGQGADATALYVDLIFAYALARLGEAADTERLLTKVRREFRGAGKRHFDQVHRWLLAAFEERTQAALAGESVSGPLSAELFGKLDGMDRVTRYKIDRMRANSRILEPHERIDPYRRCDGRYDDPTRRQLAQLFDLHDRDEIQSRLQPFLDQARRARRPGPSESWILAVALELAPRLGQDFAAQLLQQALAALNATQNLDQQSRILEKGLLAAAHFDLADAGQALAAMLEATFRAHRGEGAEGVAAALLGPSLRPLRKLGLRSELSGIMEHIAQTVRADSQSILSRARRQAGKDLAWQDSYLDRLRILLHLAAAWLYFGVEAPARRALDESRDALLEPGWEKARASRLACAYVGALGDAHIDESLERMNEVFRRLPTPVDTYTTSSHYSRLQLDVVEAAVLTLSGEQVGVGPAVRRWLDEDELLVRRRIHRDTRQALAAAGMS